MTTNADALMTAREFWTQELPGPMSILLDPDRAMTEETEAAQRTAKKMGVGVTGEAFPWFVWDALYTDPKDE